MWKKYIKFIVINKNCGKHVPRGTIIYLYNFALNIKLLPSKNFYKDKINLIKLNSNLWKKEILIN